MLRIILLSLVWAVCATCLVRPWFWKRIKKKYLFNDDGNPGFYRPKLKQELATEIFCFVVVFALSMLLYAVAGFRQNLYGSFLMIMLCFIAQCLWVNQGKMPYIIMLIIVAVSAVLCIQDVIVGYDISVPLNKVGSVPLTTTQTDADTEVKLFISSSEIKSLFKADSASDPTYNNGKYIFTVIGGDNGKGIVIIDKGNYTQANFLSCSYDFDVTNLRFQYPTQKLKKLYITISDSNVPYGLFAVADKNWIFGTYKVNSYIMLNLMTGESQKFMQEELPIFVTNN